MNVNWPRWIKASVADYFSSLLGNERLIIDGEKRPLDPKASIFELRFDGPDIQQNTRGEYNLGYTVNLLIRSSENEDDVYKLDYLKGIGANCFQTSIPIHKYGKQSSDDQSHIGCITLKTNIDVRDFGYTHETIYHVCIQGYYVFEPYERVSTYESTLAFDLNLSLEASD